MSRKASSQNRIVQFFGQQKIRVSIDTLFVMVYLKRAGRPVRSVAKECGIPASTLNRIERGYMPSIETFRLLCIWLDTSADEILGLAKQETEQ